MSELNLSQVNGMHSNRMKRLQEMLAFDKDTNYIKTVCQALPNGKKIIHLMICPLLKNIYSIGNILQNTMINFQLFGK